MTNLLRFNFIPETAKADDPLPLETYAFLLALNNIFFAIELMDKAEEHNREACRRTAIAYLQGAQFTLSTSTSSLNVNTRWDNEKHVWALGAMALIALFRTRRYRTALKLLHDAVNFAETRLGVNHPVAGAMWLLRGYIYKNSDLASDAVSTLGRAVEIFEAADSAFPVPSAAGVFYHYGIIGFLKNEAYALRTPLLQLQEQ